VGTVGHFEWEYEWSPVWQNVGRYTRFLPRLVERATAELQSAFGLDPHASLPPVCVSHTYSAFGLLSDQQFIAVHVRHGDFVDQCSVGPDVDTEENGCTAPLSAYAARVREVQDDLRTYHGVTATHVLMTSDEKDPAWWAKVRALGWGALNFGSPEALADPLGPWYASRCRVSASCD
jgi:hypothetical protein